VSALLAPLMFEGQEPLPRDLLMKVFVSKPGATPVLHFDCRGLWAEGKARGFDYAINAVRYHSSPGDGREDKYEGPEFRWCSASFFFLPPCACCYSVTCSCAQCVNWSNTPAVSGSVQENI
jgi:hypothetical protein